MAKTLAQGRKPGSGRKPGRGKTLREGRKPGSGRKKRDTVSSPDATQFSNNNSNNNSQTHISANNSSNNSQQIQTNELKRSAPINIPTPMAGSMPINSSGMNNISGNTSAILNNYNNVQNSNNNNNNNGNAENNTFTSRDMEAVDALRELTYSPQFSPPLNSLPTTLPPIVPSRSFPTINSMMTSPRSAVIPPLNLQSPPQQIQNKPTIGMISPPALPQQSVPLNSFNGLLTSPLPPSSIPVRSGPIRPVGIPHGNTPSPTVNMNQGTHFNNNNNNSSSNINNNNNGKSYIDNSMPTNLNFITNSQSASNVMSLGSSVTGMNTHSQDFTNGMVTMNNNNNNNNSNSANNSHNIYISPSMPMNPMDPSMQRPPQ